MIRMKYVWITLAVVIIIIGALWYTKSDRRESSPQLADAPLSDPNFDPRVQGGGEVTIIENEELLSVSDQVAAGSIAVGTALLEKPGFVVVHENAGGQPGDLIGASHFLSAGNNSGIKILVTTSAGNSYLAMIHNDDGDGAFNAENDRPATDGSGNTIVSEFTITPRPEN